MRIVKRTVLLTLCGLVMNQKEMGNMMTTGTSPSILPRVSLLAQPLQCQSISGIVSKTVGMGVMFRFQLMMG